MHVSSLLLIKYSPVQPAPNRRSVRCLCPCTRPRCAPARLENSSMEYRDCDVRWQPRADTHALLRWARMPLSKRHSSASSYVTLCLHGRFGVGLAFNLMPKVGYLSLPWVCRDSVLAFMMRPGCKCHKKAMPAAASTSTSDQRPCPVTTLGLQGWRARLFPDAPHPSPYRLCPDHKHRSFL